MSKKEVEYIIRLGPSDRYRHLHIKEKGKIVFFRIQYETKISDVLTFAESDLKSNWEQYKNKLQEEQDE